MSTFALHWEGDGRHWEAEGEVDSYLRGAAGLAHEARARLPLGLGLLVSDRGLEPERGSDRSL